MISAHDVTHTLGGNPKQVRMLGIALLLALLCIGAVAIVLLPLLAPAWAGSVHMAPLFGLLVATDLVLGAWLVLRLQDRWKRADSNDRMTMTDGLTVGGFAVLVLTLCLAIYISTTGALG